MWFWSTLLSHFGDYSGFLSHNVAQLLLQKTFPKPGHFLLHISLTILHTRASVFPQFDDEHNVSHRTQITKVNFGPVLLFPHNMLLSKGEPRLVMRGLVTAEWAFIPTSIKRAETDPYPVHHWIGEQFKLQCWTDSPLSLYIILSSRAFVLRGWPAFLGDLNELVSL